MAGTIAKRLLVAIPTLLIVSVFVFLLQRLLPGDPVLALAGEERDPATLAFGTPGGDQQDQWQLAFFLRYAHHGGDMQATIDRPLFHTTHFPGSFHPRTREPGNLTIERSFGDAALRELERRGHRLQVSDPWSIGRLTAAQRDPHGLLRAAATPRLMQAYAVGR